MTRDELKQEMVEVVKRSMDELRATLLQLVDEYADDLSNDIRELNESLAAMQNR